MRSKNYAVAALAALLGLGLFGAVAPAVAADTDEASITVNGKSINGHTLKAVRIATYDHVVTDTPATTVTGFDLVTVTALKAAIATWVVDRVNTAAGNEDLAVTADNTIDFLDPLVWVAQNWKSSASGLDHWLNPDADNADVRALANWLLQGLTAQPPTWALPVVTATGADDKAELETSEGLHLVWDVDAPSEAPGTTSLPMIVGTEFVVEVDEAKTLLSLPTQDLGEMFVKGELVKLDKDIATVMIDSPEGTTPEPEDVYTAATGQVLDFVIRTNVPFYLDGTDYARVFTVTDEWSEGLEPDLTTIQVTVKRASAGKPDVVLTKGEGAGSGYSVTPGVTPSGKSSLTVELTPDGITAAEGFPLVIEYKAKVTADADLLDEDGVLQRDTNAAFATFTNDWNVDNSGSTAEQESTATDTVYVYTYPFDIVKRDLVTQSIITDATVFTVTGPFANASGVVVPDASIDVTTINGLYSLIGLQGNAKYTVVEKTPPAGYTAANKDVAKFTFYIEVPATALVEGPDDGLGVPVFHYGTYDASLTLAPVNLSPGIGGSPWVNSNRIDEAGNGDAANGVDVFNAQSTSDMPATGGQILLWVGIAGVLGLGALTFGAVGIRKSLLKPATVA